MVFLAEVGENLENLPEVVFLAKVGENLAQAVLTTLLTAFFHRCNTGDNVDDVLLQDVALACR